MLSFFKITGNVFNKSMSIVHCIHITSFFQNITKILGRHDNVNKCYGIQYHGPLYTNHLLISTYLSKQKQQHLICGICIHGSCGSWEHYHVRHNGKGERSLLCCLDKYSLLLFDFSTHTAACCQLHNQPLHNDLTL